MKNKRLKILINLITICLCFLMMFPVNSYSSNQNINKWINDGNKFIANGQNGNVIDNNKVKNAVLPIGQALVAIATVVLVVVTIIMGIKWMLAKNDSGERAKLKTQLIGLVVSTIVIFGAQIIWSLLYKFMNNITK